VAPGSAGSMNADGRQFAEGRQPRVHAQVHTQAKSVGRSLEHDLAATHDLAVRPRAAPVVDTADDHTIADGDAAAEGPAAGGATGDGEEAPTDAEPQQMGPGMRATHLLGDPEVANDPVLEAALLRAELRRLQSDAHRDSTPAARERVHDRMKEVKSELFGAPTGEPEMAHDHFVRHARVRTKRVHR